MDTESRGLELEGATGQLKEGAKPRPWEVHGPPRVRVIES